ncbi:CU044_2847 family protein [Endothiovibrio diazotrophicus]
MNVIKEIALNDGAVIYIEMEEVAENKLPKVSIQQGAKDLPPGAELTSAADIVIDTMETLKGTLGSVFSTINDSVNENVPDEWGVELNIGFKGKVNPIPVIVGAESNVALKVCAKWKKKTPEAEM